MYTQGLPVFTLLGESFPSRVASSLYASLPEMWNTLFTVSSTKEFVDAIVAMLDGRIRNIETSKQLLRYQKLKLFQHMANEYGFFNEKQHVQHLLVALAALKEEKYVANKVAQDRSETKRIYSNYTYEALQKVLRRARFHLILRPTIMK